jgi:hypothetical protein
MLKIFCLLLVLLGFELSFMLAKQELYSLSQASSPFCSGYFGDRVSLIAQSGLDHSLPIYASCHS